MFIVWNGLGCLVIPVCIIGGVAAAAIADSEPNIRWPRLIAVSATSLALLGLGAILNRRQVVGQDQWGNTVSASENHSLYWIPVQYWSAIVLVVGAIFVFKK